ncbi:galactose oxidase-like domain-containing protein [Stigmatella aurantiaca]|uniref:Kelch domain protein n=1 Tax=Stigmatella aurantiaca (strain DW4/3-1) TaxID=378806 RepID=Q08S03_STIAD|nr:galactose oxidase-like domain-containing protein [Stigmatella aurantiaca]ADO72671.1 kelch domain protein [Stigmatella aurantiaca DW4/3-1]EAU63264.1 similarity to galactose oxidase from Dactylium dendroides [Stigmatella aurantiaca DW4/3-1]
MVEGQSRSAWKAVLGVCVGLLGGPAAAQVPELEGRWSPPLSWPLSAQHIHLLPDGKVMFFEDFAGGGQAPYVWEPATDTFAALPLPPFNVFGAGHSYLSDGRLLLTGGHSEPRVGEARAAIFNPYTGVWEPAPDMNDKRRYPTNTTLPDGDVLVLSGETVGSGVTNALPQRWVDGTQSWRDLSTAGRKLPHSPRMFLAPNGKLFFAGAWRSNLWLDPEGTGTWFGSTRSLHGGRAYGGAVYLDGKVLLVGGGDPPTNTVELIDLNQPSPTWTSQSPMRVARRHHNTTLLPDGTVLVTGGTQSGGFDDRGGAVFHAEIWDPETNTWHSLASGSVYRGYHSTALLLPDGRVLSAGGNGESSAEIFEPPYLFKGPRPAVQEAPDELLPGTVFPVSTPDGSQIKKVTLLALGSSTHAFDQNQRLLTLPYSVTDDGLRVSAPESNVLAPPGPYLLFLVNEAGVPSVAKKVQVGKVPSRFASVIAFSDVWKYDDGNVDRGTSWLASDYDDSAWKSGPGQFGHGDGDEATVLNATTPTQPTVYFRKKITLDKPVLAARLEALFDDGVQVWINGVPVYSKNVGNGLDFGKYASGSTSNEYRRESLSLDSAPFVVGENLVTALVKQVGPRSDDLSFALALQVQFENFQEEHQRAIAFGDRWEYDDSGVDPGPSWMAPAFDSASWKVGVGQFGHGDGDEVTVLASPRPARPSTYFRKKIHLSGPVTSASLELLFEDGVAVFVNGTQVFARNVGRLAHSKYATGSLENARETVELVLQPNPFVKGENTVAVVVKQVGATSPDLSFDLALDVGVQVPAP